MIVNRAPTLRRIAGEVWRPLGVLFVWDCLVTGFYRWSPFTAPALPLTLFGTALGLFLGFRANSAYARWWEGRGLWGAIVNASRSTARVAGAFLPDGPGDAAAELRRTIVLRQIAFVHALRCQLRREPVRDEVLRVLPEAEAAPALARANVANALLDGTAALWDAARRCGLIDTVQQASAERVLTDLANAQGGAERLKNTPLPYQYRLFPELFTRLFCLLLPIGLVESLDLATPVGSTLAGLMFLAVLRIGDDLTDPFAGTVHDVPLSALCRTIEIDLRQAIGDGAPEPARPDGGVLW